VNVDDSIDLTKPKLQEEKKKERKKTWCGT
jgi:hypothetical protein